MLQVCFVLDTVQYDAGTEKLVPRLATRLDRTRFEPHVCCFEDSERLSSIGPQVKTGVFPIARVYSPGGLRQVGRFREYLKRNRIDVVHSFTTKADIFSVLASIGLGRAMVISRLNSGYWYTPRNIRVFRMLNRYTTHVLTNSLCAKMLTTKVEGVAPEKITILNPGVDLAQFSRETGDLAVAASLGIPAEAPVVGIVATYRAVKDLPLFLHAARRMAAAVPRAAFLLVGHGELRADLETLAAELGIRERVFFTDGRGTVPDHLARMSVACLSSLSEGLPNAIMEYMAAGLPVVATDVGGNSELVTDGETGYLVRVRTAEAFAAPVIRLLQEEGLRSAMGQRGLERARAEFDLAAAVERLEKFYLKAAADVQGRN